MIDVSPSMTLSFPSAVEVLRESMTPMHYKQLTVRVCKKLGISPAPSVVLDKMAEDIREKLLAAERLGTFYVGAPFFCAGLTSWFRQELMVTPEDHVVIPPSMLAARVGAIDALNRAPFMIQKTNSSQDRLNRGRMEGKILEEQVSHYFRSNWPDFYLPPDNSGNFKRFCFHDFKLKVGNKTILYDVAGPGLDGTYRASTGKKPVDIHLLARFDGDSVRWESVVRGKDYEGDLIPETGISPVRYAVYLNCIHNNFPYQLMCEAARVL